jgi:hypothetical protein
MPELHASGDHARLTVMNAQWHVASKSYASRIAGLFVLCLSLVPTWGCGDGSPVPTPEQEARRKAILETEKSPSAQALARKERSIAILKREGVPFIQHLPVIQDEATSKSRSTEEVALRAMALCFVAVKGEGLEPNAVLKLIKDYQIEGSLSPKELAFIKNPAPSEQERVQFAWRYECYSVLLWALGFVDELPRPDKICDVKKAAKLLRDLGREGFLKKAKLRPQTEILDAADLTYRYDWVAVNARLKQEKAPTGLDAGVLVERHHALNWLIGYMDQAWDDVTTDT